LKVRVNRRQRDHLALKFSFIFSEAEMMNALDQGANPLFMNPNPDEAREFFARKSRAMTDKRMTGLFPTMEEKRR